MAYLPSIFNDVIGPVMRGPSSSHTAAALRIGQLCNQLMQGKFDRLVLRYDTAGTLAATHDGQGSDAGLCAGLMGWEADAEKLPNALTILDDIGVDIDIQIGEFGTKHPNTYLIEIQDGARICHITALSTGGGMIELIEVNGIKLSLMGDFFETCFICETENDALHLSAALEKDSICDQVALLKAEGQFLVQHKAQHRFDELALSALQKNVSLKDVWQFDRVLPIGSSAETTVPFDSCESMIAYNQGKNLALWELAMAYEAARGRVSEDIIFEKMRAIVRILEKSIKIGIDGTSYNDRILAPQAPLYKAKMENGSLMPNPLHNEVILAVTALMDVKSAFGVIVAAPTAGSCGTLPGTCLGAAKALGRSEDESVKAMLAAGIIGTFIANKATFAAEIGGCQAETGSGAGMAAAALVTLMNGSLDQAIGAASMALQNTFGLICDPVANRVEAPCLGKNVMNASNAISSANMSLAGFDALIPLDETIVAMHEVGQSLPCELRCTGGGGLATTPTAKRIEAELAHKKG